MPGIVDEAWVTLATNDRYALGALVVAGSLRDAGTTRRKVVMITDGVSQRMRTALSTLYDELFNVNAIDSGDAAHLSLLQRPDLGVTFTKLHAWRLTQYRKCVFVDADTLVVQNCDELFDREEFSAAPDAGWPDCFNSGVFVFRPSMQTFNDLVQLAETEGSFDGGDQGLLNSFFSDWGTKDISKHLSFTYNMTATAMYTYLPALKRFGRSVKIVHFIGRNKPWSAPLTSHGEPCAAPGEEGSVEHLKKWWLTFHSHVKDLLEDGAGGQLLPQQMQQLGLGQGQEYQGAQPSGQEGASSGGAAAAAPDVPSDRREAWEVGHPDYMGTAAFDNILKRIETTLSTPSMSPSASMNDLRYISLPNLDQVASHLEQHHQQSQDHHQDQSHSHNHHSHHQHHHSHDRHHHENSHGFRSRRNSNPIHLDGFISTEPTPEQNRNSWESGKPDFMGVNAFDNIKAKLDSIIPAAYDHNELKHLEQEQEAKEEEEQQPQVEQEPDHRFQGDESSYDYVLWKLKTELGEPPGVAAARERKKRMVDQEASSLQQQEEVLEEILETSLSSAPVTAVHAALAAPSSPSSINDNSALRHTHPSCPSCGHRIQQQQNVEMVSEATQTERREVRETATITDAAPMWAPMRGMRNSSGYISNRGAAARSYVQSSKAY